jgi:hypothetical protein
MFKPTPTTQQADPGAAGAAAAAAANGANGAAPPWYGSDTNKAVVETKGFKSVDDVFTWGAHTEKLFGLEKAGRTVVLPKDDKDADGIKAFRAKIGVPEKVEGYKTPEPLKDDPLWAPAAAAALEAGIPAAAFDGFLSKVLAAAGEHNAKSAEQAKAASEKAVAELKGEWGDKFDAHAELARRLVRGAGIADAELAAMEGALGTAKFLKMFHALSSQIGEHAGAGDGAGAGGGQRLTQTEARQKLAALDEQRIAGKVDDKTFAAETARLGPIAYP